MAVRMTNRQWKELPSSDKEILETLNILDLVKPLKGKPLLKESLPLPEPYILLKTFKCTLCKTIFIKHFRMLPSLQDPYVLQAKEIAFSDLLPGDRIKEEKESCTGCFHCYEILTKETKRELIKRIIILEGRRK